MERPLIGWDAAPREIAADTAATLSVDRARWEAAGARFESYQDEIGGVTAVATASVRLPAGDVEFGVLEYGAPVSYLIVAGSYAEHSTAVDVVLQALIVDDVIAADDILERLPSELVDSEPTPTTTELEYKLAELAQEVSDLQVQLVGTGAAQSGVAADVVLKLSASPTLREKMAAIVGQVRGFRWYVVNTYSGHENKVKRSLEHRVDFPRPEAQRPSGRRGH